MELNPRPTPPTSPPHIPSAPDGPRFGNLPRPGGKSVAPLMTPEEITAADEAEKAAQLQDMEDAKAEEQESNTAMAALEGAFVPNGIFRHRGVGPLIYETKRGLLKVFSGDLVCHLVGITNPSAPPEEWILDDEYIAVSEATLTALLFTVEPRLFPDLLEYRAIRIGEERRAAAAAPPPVLEGTSARKGDPSRPGKPDNELPGRPAKPNPTPPRPEPK